MNMSIEDLNTQVTMNKRLDLTLNEEDLEAAECLLVLSQSCGGYYPPPSTYFSANPKSNGASQTTPSNNKFYTCDVCGRFFSSYQALGGHKTYHRIKSPTEIATVSSTSTEANHISSVNHSERLHKCSVCHKTFLSGQALGGHMGKHKEDHCGRSSGVSSSIDHGSTSYFHGERDGYVTPIPRNFDLNLPPYF